MDEKSPEKKPAKKQEAVHEVVFYTYPKLLFAWPMIVMGLLFYFLSPIANTEVLAWIAAITTVATLLCMGVDLNRNVTIFWIALLAGIFFFILYMNLRGVMFFKNIYRWLADIDPEYNRKTGLVISLLLGVPYLIMIVKVRMDSKWRITHNEFEHYSLGRADDSLARGAKRVRTRYPDLLEFLFCLAGSLEVWDARGRRLLRRISNVPFLPIVKKRVNTILEARRVSVQELDDEEEEEEEAAEELGEQEYGADEVEGAEGPDDDEYQGI